MTHVPAFRYKRVSPSIEALLVDEVESERAEPIARGVLAEPWAQHRCQIGVCDGRHVGVAMLDAQIHSSESQQMLEILIGPVRRALKFGEHLQRGCHLRVRQEGQIKERFDRTIAKQLPEALVFFDDLLVGWMRRPGHPDLGQVREPDRRSPGRGDRARCRERDART